VYRRFGSAVFQSTHPCGVRLEFYCHPHVFRGFQSTHPCGVRLRVVGVEVDPRMFQSTHPCGVRPRVTISILLPPRFQSTHPCGVRLQRGGRLLCQGAFQSTHPCGVRPRAAINGEADILVSIHAPLRGATVVFNGGYVTQKRFNPRTPAGCDPKTFYLRLIIESFQSTHPCGVRPTQVFGWLCRAAVSIHAPLRGATTPQVSVLCASPRFNPRTPAGCD